ncbi:MAG: ribokinase [Solobacterium sp.]|nr:ribokinase [Solobacterium sp.]
MKILVIGSSNVDITAAVHRFPEKGETVIGEDLRYAFGGKGANQATACGKLGGDIVFLTCVGNDTKGHETVAALSENHVDTSYVRFTDRHPTGTAVITVDHNGDNSIIVIQGANLDCNKQYLEANEKLFAACDYVLLQMEIPLDAVERAVELAAAHGKKVILNPAPADPAFRKDLYRHITYITPNETEVSIMAYGAPGHGVEESAAKLIELGVQNVIVTLGCEGSMLVKQDGTSVRIPAHRVEAVDTVAAGDCYNGALVKALSEGREIEEAMEYAGMASALAVTRYGAQKSIPTKEELEAFGGSHE